jgi:hypothetical protein
MKIRILFLIAVAQLISFNLYALDLKRIAKDSYMMFHLVPAVCLILSLIWKKYFAIRFVVYFLSCIVILISLMIHLFMIGGELPASLKSLLIFCIVVIIFTSMKKKNKLGNRNDNSIIND